MTPMQLTPEQQKTIDEIALAIIAVLNDMAAARKVAA